MVESHKLILLELERSRFCFAAAIRRSELDVGAKAILVERVESTDRLRRTGSLQALQDCVLAAGLEAIRAQLRRARHAAGVASACVELADHGTLICAAEEASAALTFVAAAVITPGRQQLAAEAIEAELLAMELARTLAQHHHRQAFAASDICKHALAAGDPVAAAHAAIQAGDASDLAVWATRLGGAQPARHEASSSWGAAAQVASLHAAGIAAAQLAEIAVGGSSPGCDLTCFITIGPAVQQSQLEQLQKRPRLSA